MIEITGSGAGTPLPPMVQGYCPWKERDADGADRVCVLREGHDGDCDMQPVITRKQSQPKSDEGDT